MPEWSQPDDRQFKDALVGIAEQLYPITPRAHAAVVSILPKASSSSETARMTGVLGHNRPGSRVVAYTPPWYAFQALTPDLLSLLIERLLAQSYHTDHVLAAEL